jgi:hypothetical protein
VRFLLTAHPLLNCSINIYYTSSCTVYTDELEESNVVS